MIAVTSIECGGTTGISTGAAGGEKGGQSEVGKQGGARGEKGEGASCTVGGAGIM